MICFIFAQYCANTVITLFVVVQVEQIILISLYLSVHFVLFQFDIFLRHGDVLSHFPVQTSQILQPFLLSMHRINI